MGPGSEERPFWRFRGRIGGFWRRSLSPCCRPGLGRTARYAAGCNACARSSKLAWPAGRVMVTCPSRSSSQRTLVRVMPTTRPAPSYSMLWPSGVDDAVVGSCSRRENRLEVIEQPRTAPLSEVQMRASIEHNPPTVGVDNALLLVLHGRHDTRGWRQR